MKTTPAPQFSEITGKIGNLTVQKRKTGLAISKLPIPYSISGEERTAAQLEINANYAIAIATWRESSQAQRDAWEALGAELSISGFNYFVWAFCRLPADRGLLWTLSQRLGTETQVYSLANLGGGICIAGTYPTGKVWRSTDGGITWTLSQRLGTETHVPSLANLGGGICIAGTIPTGQVYRSTDGGITWTLSQRLGTETYVLSLANLGGGICIAGTVPTGKVWRSTS